MLTVQELVQSKNKKFPQSIAKANQRGAEENARLSEHNNENMRQYFYDIFGKRINIHTNDYACA